MQITVFYSFEWSEQRLIAKSVLQCVLYVFSCMCESINNIIQDHLDRISLASSFYYMFLLVFFVCCQFFLSLIELIQVQQDTTFFSKLEVANSSYEHTDKHTIHYNAHNVQLFKRGVRINCNQKYRINSVKLLLLLLFMFVCR